MSDSMEPAVLDAPVALASAAAPTYLDHIATQRNHQPLVVRMADVQWLESSGNYVIFHAGADRIEVRGTLASFEARLDPRHFVRIHRRVLVALDAIRELQPWFGGDQILYLRDGTKLRVSRTHRAHLDRALKAR
ncbi:MAG TPA: LytTR family DNA-binding domain-containing protein [Gemmatimonadaceae bacterium]|nr:LytTR family DNA-binding domain-containing protein [Gemmatimonadaceae bacterium]